MKQEYTLSIFTENHIGMLHRVTIIFTRRHINIESITASQSEVEGIHRYTIVIREELEQVQKVVKQIEKQVDVIRAHYHKTDELIYQEIALYKLSVSAISDGLGIETIIRENNARLLTIENEHLIIEKTGHKEETTELFEKLKPFGIVEFVRSGRVAIMKDTVNEFEKLEYNEEA